MLTWFLEATTAGTFVSVIQFQDLLAFTRHQRVELSCKPIELSEVVTAALNYLEGEITRTAATISVGEVQFRVIGNKESLTHVLINFLSNALKFVAEGIKPQIQIFS